MTWLRNFIGRSRRRRNHQHHQQQQQQQQQQLRHVSSTSDTATCTSSFFWRGALVVFLTHCFLSMLVLNEKVAMFSSDIIDSGNWEPSMLQSPSLTKPGRSRSTIELEPSIIKTKETMRTTSVTNSSSTASIHAANGPHTTITEGTESPPKLDNFKVKKEPPSATVGNIKMNQKISTKLQESTKEEARKNVTDISDVWRIDESARKNVQETYATAQSSWNFHPPSVNSFSTASVNLPNFTTYPLMATVHTSPARQLKLRQKYLLYNNQSMSCGFLTSSYLSHFSSLRPEAGIKSECQICFGNDASCIEGKAVVPYYFPDWQREQFPVYGYPWNVECQLPPYISHKDLTCEALAKLRLTTPITVHTKVKIAMSNERDEIEDKIMALAKKQKQKKLNISTADITLPEPTSRSWIEIQSQWDWKALEHPDQVNIHPSTPSKPSSLKVAIVEGPKYDMQALGLAVDTKLGHVRSQSVWLAKIFHLLRTAPGLTYIMGTIEGGRDSVSTNFKEYGDLFLQPLAGLFPVRHINSLLQVFAKDKHIRNNGGAKLISPNMTLAEALRWRRMQMRLVPLAVPAPVVEDTVCGAQYAYVPYISARFFSEFHVVVYMDDDTVLVEPENSGMHSLQDILFDVFYTMENRTTPMCPGWRFPILENYVQPQDHSRILDCVEDNWWTDPARKQKMKQVCWNLKPGHVMGRSDALDTLKVHFSMPNSVLPPDMVASHQLLPPKKGQHCQPHSVLDPQRLVQMHLRNRQRKPVCTCFSKYD